ncbi:MAG: ParB/RepB/Spo0J family partition protein [Pelagimonas sp.]|jgi:ParB family chromosome partitioning protein|nr:ParB/RepB/Spo0J family partition protein [Pelagimonas sp.]
MTKKHDAIFDDVLSGLDAPAPASDDRAGARFLKRSTTISERLSGELEEKTLRWVDPARCRMWARHNRDYALLNEENCRDLIDGIRSQGRQEFPAIVRRVDDPDFDYEVVCGARRHFAVSWLRDNNYTQFKYLVEVRDITDEEAFRLADIENRDREDISDYERAIDYADAVDRYYNGKQKAMAARLEVSQPWLSRYLQLAKLPSVIVGAFASVRDLRERNARELKPLLADAASAKPILEEAAAIGREQLAARAGRGSFVDAAVVMRRLVRAGKPVVPKAPADVKLYRRGPGERGINVRRKGRKTVIEFEDGLSRDQLEASFAAYLRDVFSD